ncbi:unnamed protein product [Ascophyllum nodosum]
MASPSASPTLNQRDGTVVDDASGLVSVIQEASSGETAEDHVYCCRMCRRTILTQGEVETHEVARQSFHRRKCKVGTSTKVCSSVFLGEPLPWMKQQTGEVVEGKLFCPNKSCGVRLGSLKWTGAQCSCGSWVTPAIQFPKKNLDVRSAAPLGPPPGTVVHASVLEGTRGSREAREGRGTPAPTCPPTGPAAPSNGLLSLQGIEKT